MAVLFLRLQIASITLLQVVHVACSDVLRLTGVSSCFANSTVIVHYADISFNKDSALMSYNVSGTSKRQQKVEASLTVAAYGQLVFQKSLDPCDNSTFISQLCPVPEGTFNAAGSQEVPPEIMDKIPLTAFTLPNIDARATLEITSQDSNEEQACIRSGVTNGKSLQTPAIGAISSALAGVSLLLASVISSAGTTGNASPSPNFSTIFGWFQSMAMNGMLSVSYPPIYSSFCQNFGFATGLISTGSLQTSLNRFTASMGGLSTGKQKRARYFVTYAQIWARDASIPQSEDGSDTITSNAKEVASGIDNYVEMLSVPRANTFLTVLVAFAIVVAAVIVGILGLKLALEIWALFASFPNSLVGFRKRYWRTIANTLANLILLLYGIWTIWCIFQWTNTDSSWIVRLLAAITWSLFTGVILFYTVKLILVVRRHKRQDGNTAGLYDDNDTWHKYSFLYDSYRQGYWWTFVPVITYTFAKGVVIAVGNGHGMAQTVAQLIIEVIMLLLLLCFRPFATKGSNWINNVIQIVRVLSVACILVFVDQIGISQSTKTMTGLALVVVQGILTAILSILLAVNALRACVMTNPHVRRRKEAKLQKQQLQEGEFARNQDSLCGPDYYHAEIANQKPRDRLSRPLRVRSEDTILV